jgi:hypothetical protein
MPREWLEKLSCAARANAHVEHAHVRKTLRLHVLENGLLRWP